MGTSGPDPGVAAGCSHRRRGCARAGGVFALGLGLYAATRADVRALEAREQALVTALELASNRVLDRQIELLYATTSQSGFICHNANISIEALMADNERLLSTLEAALEPVDSPPRGALAAKSSGAVSGVEADGAGLQRLEYELAFSQTQQDMLAAELNRAPDHRNTLRCSGRSGRCQCAGAIAALAQTVERRDELIAVLKRDLAAVSPTGPRVDAARHDQPAQYPER